MICAEPQLVEAARSGDAAAVERLLVVCQPLAEAAFVAAAVRAGGTLAHSLMALRLFDDAG
jgi:hypothetical protein